MISFLKSDDDTEDEIKSLAESIKPSDSVSQIGRNVNDDVSVVLSSAYKKKEEQK